MCYVYSNKYSFNLESEETHEYDPSPGHCFDVNDIY